MIVMTSLTAFAVACLLASAAAESIPSWHHPVQRIAPLRFTVEADGARLTLPYVSTHPLDKTHPGVERLILCFHGAKREACDYFDSMHRAVPAGIPLDSLAIVSPQFLELRDLEKHQPQEASLLYFGGGWREGDRSLSTESIPRPARISNFAVIDDLLAHCLDRFPDLKHLVLVGHSAGGQLVNRYSIAGRFPEALRKSGKPTPDLRFIVYNPSTHAWLSPKRFSAGDPQRFKIPEDAEGYNDWKYGLEKPNHYLASRDPREILKAFPEKQVIYMIGELDNETDHESLEVSPKVSVQGASRLERTLNYYRHLGQVFGDAVYRNQHLCILPGIGHESYRGFASPGGRYWIFDHGEPAPGPVERYLMPPPTR